MTTLIDALNEVIKYDADKARDIERNGTDAHRTASALAYKAALGDDVALGALADHLSENDHPLAGLLNDIRDGKAVALKDQYATAGMKLNHSTSRRFDNYHLRPEGAIVSGNKSIPNAGDIKLDYLHTPLGHFFEVGLVAPHPKGSLPLGQRHFLVQATPEQAQEYADGLKEIGNKVGSNIEHHLNTEPPLGREEQADPDEFDRHFLNAGLSHLLPQETASYSRSIEQALKYATSSKEDFYPSLLSGDPTAHSVFAAYLQERNENDPLLHKLRSEIERQNEGVRAEHLSDAYDDKDFVLHALRTGHNNPSVRAFAGLSAVGHPPHSDLLNLLFHSDHPSDQDAAVYLSEADHPDTHSSHAHLRRLNSPTLRDAGLEAKPVRGTVYLLDHEAIEPNHNGAPAIQFTAPVNDHSELAEMEHWAHRLAAQRAGTEGATVGPVTYA